MKLSDSNFRKVVLDGPRSYGTVVLFTVDSPKYPCPACGQALEHVRAARYSVEMAASRNSSAAPEQLLWTTCNFVKCNSVFATFGMRNAPSIAYFAPNSRREKWTQTQAELPAGSFLQPSDVQTAQRVLDIMGVAESVRLVRPAVEQRGVSVVTAAAVALLALWAGGNGGKLALWKSPAAWRLLCLLTFGLAVSGLVFCIIRAPPLLGVDGKGKPVLLSTGGREQYLGEGLWVGALTLAAAGMLITLVNVAKRGRGDLTNLALGVPLLLGAAAILFRLLQLYQIKTSWYSPVSSLPASWQHNFAQLLRWLQNPHVNSGHAQAAVDTLRRGVHTMIGFVGKLMK